EQRQSEHEHHRPGDREGRSSEEPDIDYGVLLIILPDQRENQRRSRHYREPENEMRAEPVLTLALVENHLQGAQPDADHPQPHIIDSPYLPPHVREPGRVFHQPRGQDERKRRDRNVDEEHPAPAEMIGDVSAQSGTY